MRYNIDTEIIGRNRDWIGPLPDQVATWGESMRCCGADIAGADLVLAIVDSEAGSYSYVSANPSKIRLKDDHDQTMIRMFFDTATAFIRDNNINLIAIKKRATKGPFASGGTTFKIEGLLQLIQGCTVVLCTPQAIIAKSKSKKFLVPDKVFAYQKDAFLTACYALASQDE